MQKFDTATPITAVLDIPAGRVQLIAADRTDATVEVRPVNPGKGRDVRAAEQTTVEYRDGVLQVQGPAGRQLLGSFGSVEVTVKLPTGSRVEAKTASVDFRGVGRLGDVSYESSEGLVKVDEAASVRLTTAAGDVRLGRLNGSAEISTQKGDITIAEASAGTVVLRTQAGDVEVGAAAGVSASLDARTSRGRISNSLRNDGTAGLEIRATTAYGDITARSL